MAQQQTSRFVLRPSPSSHDHMTDLASEAYRLGIAGRMATTSALLLSMHQGQASSQLKLQSLLPSQPCIYMTRWTPQTQAVWLDLRGIGAESEKGVGPPWAVGGGLNERALSAPLGPRGPASSGSCMSWSGRSWGAFTGGTGGCWGIRSLLSCWIGCRKLSGTPSRVWPLIVMVYIGGLQAQKPDRSWRLEMGTCIGEL